MTDAEILEQYRLARDVIVAAIAAGRDVVEYQVMSQRKRTADPVAELRIIETQIAYYQRLVDAAAGGRARNYVALVRAYGDRHERSGQD